MVDSQFVPGCKIAGKYILVRRLGSGGMSDIWLAENEATGAEVALKVARGCDVGQDDARVLRARFRNEARACAKLGHRNIVRVFDLIEEEGSSPLLVMERLHGCTLSELLATKGKLDPTAMVAIMLPILAGLTHAHRAGVIHRDIKPENVFLALEPDGLVTPKLLDFGVAKFSLSKDNLTVNGMILGTPQYMSPEQIRAQKLDVRSDIFSLGTMLYEALSGTSPFEADSTSAALAAVLERMPEPIEFIPAAMRDVVSRALDKAAERRPASAAALATELREACGATDAELTQSMVSLVPSEAIDPRHSLASMHVCLRPPGTSMRPAAALALQATLSGETMAVAPRTSPAMRRRAIAAAVAFPLFALIVVIMAYAANDRPSTQASDMTAMIGPTSVPAETQVAAAASSLAPIAVSAPAITSAKDDVLPAPSPSSSGARRSRARVALTPGF